MMRCRPSVLIVFLFGVVVSCNKVREEPLGTITCWGLGQSGQLGNGQDQESEQPVSITPPINDATELFAAGSRSCAKRASGTFECWGGHAAGLFGAADSNRSTPGPMTTVPDAVEIALGSLHACARRASGEVLCWGTNLVGELGNGKAPDPNTKVAMQVDGKGAVEVVGSLPPAMKSDKPVAVTGLADAVEIAAGRSHTCARRRDGSVVVGA